MSVPRLLHLAPGGVLHQCPAPELAELRIGLPFVVSRAALSPSAPLALPGWLGATSLDIEVRCLLRPLLLLLHIQIIHAQGDGPGDLRPTLYSFFPYSLPLCSTPRVQ